METPPSLEVRLEELASCQDGEVTQAIQNAADAFFRERIAPFLVEDDDDE